MTKTLSKYQHFHLSQSTSPLEGSQQHCRSAPSVDPCLVNHILITTFRWVSARKTNSSALAMVLHLFCTNPSIFPYYFLMSEIQIHYQHLPMALNVSQHGRLTFQNLLTFWVSYLSDFMQCSKLSQKSCQSSWLEYQIINIELKKILRKVPSPPPKLSASGRRTGSNLEHCFMVITPWLHNNHAWQLTQCLVPNNTSSWADALCNFQSIWPRF